MGRRWTILGGIMAAWLALAGSAWAACVAPAADGSLMVTHDGASLFARVAGSGPTLVFVPSLGRGVGDFKALADDLARTGYRVVLPDPRGIGQSRGPLGDLTLADLAGDVLAVADALCTGPVTIVGHAFGGRVARAAAELGGTRVDRLVLLALNGKTPVTDVLRRQMSTIVAQGFRSDAARLRELQSIYFAPGNNAQPWLRGWYPFVASAQNKAAERSDKSLWWRGGSVPTLVIQASHDVLAPLADADAFATEFGGRVTLVRLPQASHAMLPEQPRALAAVIEAFLAGGNPDYAALVAATIQKPSGPPAPVSPTLSEGGPELGNKS